MLKKLHPFLAQFAVMICFLMQSCNAPSRVSDPVGVDSTELAIRRPPFCGVWGIWGGENVSAEGRPGSRGW